MLETLRIPESDLHGLLSEHMAPAAVARADDCAAAGGAKATIDLIDDYIRQAENALRALPGSVPVANLTALPRRYAAGVFDATVPAEHRGLFTELWGGGPVAV